MILERPLGRDIEEIFRHELGDIGHDAEVRLQRTALFPNFRILEALRLEYRQVVLQCQRLDRVGRPPFPVRRAIDTDDILAAIEQRLQHRLSKGLLAVNDNSHPSPFRAFLSVLSA